jgi:imidazole glycerol phosphate synthase subunit HisF
MQYKTSGAQKQNHAQNLNQSWNDKVSINFLVQYKSIFLINLIRHKNGKFTQNCIILNIKTALSVLREDSRKRG